VQIPGSTNAARRKRTPMGAIDAERLRADDEVLGGRDGVYALLCNGCRDCIRMACLLLVWRNWLTLLLITVKVAIKSRIVTVEGHRGMQRSG
jgi:hypothetical protein